MPDSRAIARIKEEAAAHDRLAAQPRTDINPWTGKPWPAHVDQHNRNRARLLFAAAQKEEAHRREVAADRRGVMNGPVDA